MHLHWNVNWMTILSSFVMPVVTAALTARLTLWLESKKNLVKRLDEKTLQVQYKALRKDKEGYFIPGEGRLDIHEKAFAEARKQRGRIAFICKDVTGIGEAVPHYRVGRMMPL